MTTVVADPYVERDLIADRRSRGLDAPDVLQSEVIPLSFRLIPGDVRPRIEVVHSDGGQR